MRLHHRNMTIELSDDDPRVSVIELMLFGHSTALSVFTPAPSPAPATPPGPQLELPKGTRAFWKALPEVCRQELRLLATEARQVDELCRALNVEPRALQGVHFRTNRLARRFRVKVSLKRAGHDRLHRRFWIPAEQAAWIRALVAEERAATPT